MTVTSEARARRLLREFQAWYNEDRVHLALAKDTPDHRPVETPEMGEIVSSLVLAEGLAAGK